MQLDKPFVKALFEALGRSEAGPPVVEDFSGAEAQSASSAILFYVATQLEALIQMNDGELDELDEITLNTFGLFRLLDSAGYTAGRCGLDIEVGDCGFLTGYEDGEAAAQAAADKSKMN